VLGFGGNFWLAVLGTGRLTQERMSGSPAAVSAAVGCPGRLHVLADLDARLALDGDLLHCCYCHGRPSIGSPELAGCSSDAPGCIHRLLQ
jgi:hypothetical protein